MRTLSWTFIRCRHWIQMANASAEKEKPWHAAFPQPQSRPSSITAQQLHHLMQSHPSSSPDESTYLVVDVRRTDFEVAFIKGAINLPAQSFYQTLPSLLPILQRYRRVIFHCQSSNGRGPRCAGWYQDALDARGIQHSQAEVLQGGIKAWCEAYKDAPERTALLDGHVIE